MKPWDEKFEKLLRKLETLGLETFPSSIRALDIDEFGETKGVGGKYVRLLREAKKQLALDTGGEEEVPKNNAAELLTLAQQEGLRLRRLALSKVQQKALDKCTRALESDFFVVEVLLTSELDSLHKKPGIGRSSVVVLRELRTRVLEHLASYARVPGTAPNDALFSISAEESFAAPDIDDLLLEDLDEFLLSSGDDARLIVMHRTGFGLPKMPLEALGRAFSVTRERIRQLESSHFEILRQSLRLSIPVLRENLLAATESTPILEALPRFAACFDEERHAAALLSKIAGIDFLKREGLSDGCSPRLLEPFFADWPSSASETVLVEYLILEEGMSQSRALNSVRQLRRSGSLVGTEQKLSPTNMRRKEALAHLLAGAPSPLHWKVIVKTANERVLAMSPFSMERPPPALALSEYIYLAGRGTYWHTRFLDVDSLSSERAAQICREFLVEDGGDSANLTRIFHERSHDIPVDYWTFRYIVSSFEGELGLYFHGQSSVDTVSQSPDGDRVPLQEMLFRAIAAAEEPLSANELANMTRTGNTALVSLHLGKLLKTSRIARATYTTYCTAEQLTEDCDEGLLVEWIRELLTSAPVWEADAVREQLNPKLGIEQTYHWWLSVAKKLHTNGGWYVGGSLVGVESLPENGLRGVMIKLGWNRPAEDLIRELGQLVRCTSSTINRVRMLLYNNQA